jgi:hypothetical protein
MPTLEKELQDKVSEVSLIYIVFCWRKKNIRKNLSRSKRSKRKNFQSNNDAIW